MIALFVLLALAIGGLSYLAGYQSGWIRGYHDHIVFVEEMEEKAAYNKKDLLNE